MFEFVVKLLAELETKLNGTRTELNNPADEN